jgi:hypothetical protein
MARALVIDGVNASTTFWGVLRLLLYVVRPA